MITTEKAVVLNGLSEDATDIWTPEDQNYFDRCIAAITELQS